MPGPAKPQAVFQFSDQYGKGWSETAWLAAPPSSIQTAISWAYQWYNARNQFLAIDCALDRCRIQGQYPRNSYVVDLNPSPGQPTGAYSSPTGPDFVALVFDFDTEFAPARFFSRGVPASVVTGDGFSPDQTFKAGVANFASFLSGANCPFVARTGSNWNAAPFQLVNNAAPLSPRGFTFQSPNNYGVVGGAAYFTLGTVVGYNGRKTITSLAPAVAPLIGYTYTVGGAAPQAPEVTPTNLQMRAITYNFSPFLDGGVSGITHRPTGRPFGVTPGRRRTLLSLRR